jgi:hypothetical protein
LDTKEETNPQEVWFSKEERKIFWDAYRMRCKD